jgi:hypothetical protein
VAAGKTGTAQVYSLKGAEYKAESVKKELRDHALFIAFAPADKPKIALAVLVENGGFGAQAAAPIARQVLDYYLLGKRPKAPAPPTKPPSKETGNESRHGPVHAPRAAAEAWWRPRSDADDDHRPAGAAGHRRDGQRLAGTHHLPVGQRGSGAGRDARRGPGPAAAPDAPGGADLPAGCCC